MTSYGVEIHKENYGIIYFHVFLCFSKGPNLENSESKYPEKTTRRQ